METDNKISPTDLQLRNLSEHIPPEKAFGLGLSLGLTKTDLSGIIRTNDPIGNAFRVLVCWRTNLDPTLIGWRNKVEGRRTELVKLKAALKENGLQIFISCIDAHVTIEGKEINMTTPTVNLALPNPSHEAHRRQEIDILSTVESGDDILTEKHRSHLYHLITHPADSEESWSVIRGLKSIFEPYARLKNIMVYPLRFTVDVVTLKDLNSLWKDIGNGQLAEDLLPKIMTKGTKEGAVQADLRPMALRLEVDKESFATGVQFFKDLDPTLSSQDDGDHGTSQTSTEEDGFNVWTARRPKTDVEMQDSQERGAKLVWRNVSQHNFGF
ncbi:uncharacterized protein LOC121424949 [Lytechinus variegatus]|uniref:uncharacterized protein LOC121424949 n=1 Tax=Lytechinus variegatus TaxID=7654 RepID=UPI001BB2CA7E|nr:uncharacterized protein LOC121424949 [Lytechinus variegatus]